MRRAHVRKTEYVGHFVEPDLRATIEAAARRRNLKNRRVAEDALATNDAGQVA